jgi:ribosomal protein S18 acetylase RimI-like enzyme
VYERGRLRAVANVHEAPRWSDEYVAKLVAQLEPKLGDGGVFLGAFDGDVLAGVGVLGGRFLGLSRNQLEVAFLHVSRAYRRRGIARRLMDELADRARRRGAEELYISATESESAVGFYLSYGCRLAERVDPELYRLEPDDIHFTLNLRSR